MTIWLKLGVGLAALTLPAVLREAGYATDAAHPTVVELFQSQGCSDCLPAAANVAAISDRPDVLALSFAVDYWDRLGWKDTFSKPAWTAREYAYAHAMRRDDVYTPPAEHRAGRQVPLAHKPPSPAAEGLRHGLKFEPVIGLTALPNPIRFSSVHVRIRGGDEFPSGSNRLARRSWCPST
jgi:hypothetical protein